MANFPLPSIDDWRIAANRMYNALNAIRLDLISADGRLAMHEAATLEARARLLADIENGMSPSIYEESPRRCSKATSKSSEA